jgi:thiol-disulfide isomerase/thioredoxin
MTVTALPLLLITAVSLQLQLLPPANALVSPSTRNNARSLAVCMTDDQQKDDAALWDEASTAAVAPRPKATLTPATKVAAVTTTTTDEPSLESRRKTNIAVAVASVVLALSNYLYHYLNPVSPLALLVNMQSQSAPLTLIGKNNKPTVVDFWAPWCTNCQYMAATLASIEGEYAGRVNFVMVDGDRAENWPLIERFGVDAIPHLVLVDRDGNVETALIGPVPKSVMRADLDALLMSSGDKGEQLPYVMLDVFADRPDMRKVSFPE